MIITRIILIAIRCYLCMQCTKLRLFIETAGIRFSINVNGERDSETVGNYLTPEFNENQIMFDNLNENYFHLPILNLSTPSQCDRPLDSFNFMPTRHGVYISLLWTIKWRAARQEYRLFFCFSLSLISSSSSHVLCVVWPTLDPMQWLLCSLLKWNGETNIAAGVDTLSKLIGCYSRV